MSEPLCTRYFERELVDHYVRGHCHHFAIGLHRLTGWPLAVLWDREPSSEEGADPLIKHVFCMTPDGLAIDVEGTRDLARLKAVYKSVGGAEGHVEPVTELGLRHRIEDSETLRRFLAVREDQIRLAQDYMRGSDAFRALMAELGSCPRSVSLEALRARQIIRLLDLTDLRQDATIEDVDALCRSALTPTGPVAAVCVPASFVLSARMALRGTEIPIATVANFPDGKAEPDRVWQEVHGAVVAGAKEIDVVLPYLAYIAGDREKAMAVVEAAREACGESVVLKVILESGAFEDPELLAAACRDAIAAGADFLKTSTGRLSPGATPEHVAVMLDAIKAVRDEQNRTVGFKAAGGIRDPRDALQYLLLALERMGHDYLRPQHFRIGASGLLGPLLSVPDR
jgi:deoxyribose-phosphate aldolase